MYKQGESEVAELCPTVGCSDFVFCMFLTYLRIPFRFKEPTVAAEGGSLNSIIKGLTDVVEGQGWGRYGEVGTSITRKKCKIVTSL